jgi:pimeloyl-ACP methyl ester carboxylesterase
VLCLVGDITLPDYGRAAQRIAKALPSLEIVPVPGAGHVLNTSHPDAVVDAVRRAAALADAREAGAAGGGPALTA